MPQHPRYTNSPAKNIEKLYELLAKLEGFGLIHEELHQSIDIVMSELHTDAFDAYVKSESGDSGSDQDDKEDDDEPLWGAEEDAFVTIPGAYTLFDYVDEDSREQFVQDLRNVIGHYLSSGSFITDGVAEEMLGYRDIDYYRANVYVEEDTETLEKYDFHSRSVWFPSDISPARPGIYEVSSRGYESPKLSGYAYWNGKKWFDSCVLLKDCRAQKKIKSNERMWGGYCWRGFLNEIKD